MLKDILSHKAKYGTYKFLLRNYEIKSAINKDIYNNEVRNFISKSIPNFITAMQNVRNESVHGDSTPLHECKEIRIQVIGIGQSGILTDLKRYIEIL